eukprot:scaffold185824_cov47-Attheya_sp.AAC.3
MSDIFNEDISVVHIRIFLKMIPHMILLLLDDGFTLVGKEVAIELKNDVVLTGTLHSVDQYLNVKLTDVQVVNKEQYPQLVPLRNCFIRGSVVRYIQIAPGDVDTELLQDATRKENAPPSSKNKT